MNKIAILACAVFAIVAILAAPVLADSAYPGPGSDGYPAPDETVTGDTFPTDWPNHTEVPIYVMRTMTAQATIGDTSIIDAVTEVAPIVTAEPTASQHHDAQPTATPRAVKAIYAALRGMRS